MGDTDRARRELALAQTRPVAHSLYVIYKIITTMKNEKLSPVLCLSFRCHAPRDFVEPARVPRPQHLLEFSCTPSLSFVFIFSRETAKSDICPSGPRRFGHAVAHKARRRLTQVRKPAEASGGDLVCSDSRHILVNVDVHVLLAG